MYSSMTWYPMSAPRDTASPDDGAPEDVAVVARGGCPNKPTKRRVGAVRESSGRFRLFAADMIASSRVVVSDDVFETWQLGNGVRRKHAGHYGRLHTPVVESAVRPVTSQRQVVEGMVEWR